MTISSATGGAALAQEIHRLIRETSDNLSTTHRDAARSAADEQLRLGLEAADQQRAAAKRRFAGAMLGAAITATEGAGKTWIAVESRPSQTDEVGLKRLGNTSAALGSTAQAVRIGSRGFEARADAAMADATESRARADYEGRRADEHAAARRDAKEAERHAREDLKEVRAAEHASMMAVISQRA